MNKHATPSNKQRLDKLAEARRKLKEVAKGLPRREWRPYVMPQLMREAMKRVEEYKALPSRLV